MSSFSAKLTTQDSVSCFGVRTSSSRIELKSADGRTVSVAARALKPGEDPSNLSLINRHYWMPVKVENERGEKVDILINRSSYFKRLTSLGFNSKQIQASLVFIEMEDRLKSLAFSEIKNKVIEKDSVLQRRDQKEALFKEMGMTSQIEKREALYDAAIKELIDHPEKYDLNNLDFVQKSFGDDDSRVILKSYYDRASNKRIISLVYTTEEIRLFEKPQDAKLAKEYDQRVSCFEGLAAIRSDKEHFKITEGDLRDIIGTLVGSKLRSLTDHKVDESSRAPLGEVVTYPIEISKKFSGLSRSIVILSKNEILLVSSAKRKDEIIGKGSFKRVKKAVSLTDGKAFAAFKKRADPSSVSEITVRKAVSDIPGITKIHAETPRRIVEDLYDGELRKQNLGALSFDQKVTIISGLLRTLKSLNDRGLIHRDIKPNNILYKIVNGNCEVALSDLGLTGAKGSDRMKHYAGTEGFMPPEIADDMLDGEVRRQLTDESVDIYAMGLTLLSAFEFPKQAPVMATAMPAMVFDDEMPAFGFGAEPRVDLGAGVGLNIFPIEEMPELSRGSSSGAAVLREARSQLGSEGSELGDLLDLEVELGERPVALAAAQPLADSSSSDVSDLDIHDLEVALSTPKSVLPSPALGALRKPLSQDQTLSELRVLAHKMSSPKKEWRATWPEIQETLIRLGL